MIIIIIIIIIILCSPNFEATVVNADTTVPAPIQYINNNNNNNNKHNNNNNTINNYNLLPNAYKTRPAYNIAIFTAQPITIIPGIIANIPC